jgi:hypothetical protein
MDPLTIMAIASVLGSAAKGRSEGKQAEAQATISRDQAANSRYNTMLNAYQMQNQTQPMSNLRQAGAGSLMSTWQPVKTIAGQVPSRGTVTGPVRSTITGGPSITDAMRATGASVAGNAMQRQLGGNQITNPLPSQSGLGLTQLPKSGLLDSLLSYGGLGASLAAALAPAFQRKPKPDYSNPS